MLSGATERNTRQSEGETVPTPVHRPTELEPYVFHSRGTVVQCSLTADRSRAFRALCDLRRRRASTVLSGPTGPDARPAGAGRSLTPRPECHPRPPDGYPGSPLRVHEPVFHARTTARETGAGEACTPGIPFLTPGAGQCRRTAAIAGFSAAGLHKQSLRSPPRPRSSSPSSALLGPATTRCTGTITEVLRQRCHPGLFPRATMSLEQGLHRDAGTF